MRETGLLASFDRIYDRFVNWCVAKENKNMAGKPLTHISQYYPSVNSPEVTVSVISIIHDMFPVERFPVLNKLLLNEAEYTPLGSIRTLSDAIALDSVRDMPEFMENPSEALLGTRWTRISYTMWVLYDKDDNGFLVNPRPTSGSFTCGPDTLEYGFPMDEMPWDVVRAIKVTIGTRIFDSELRGFHLEHYAR